MLMDRDVEAGGVAGDVVFGIDDEVEHIVLTDADTRAEVLRRPVRQIVGEHGLVVFVNRPEDAVSAVRILIREGALNGHAAR